MIADIGGRVDARFDAVAQQFLRNFTDHGELGASVCVIHEGETVVDLWGGFTDAKRDKRWDENTLTVVFSCTKGAVALCAHVLASREELDFDRPVGYYWPEFACNGKSEITTRMLLNHQAGLPGLSQVIRPDDAHEPYLMAQMLADERPLWRPGAGYGYHVLTFGWLVGEVVRRVAGDTIGRFFAREIAQPVGVDFWIGLPESERARVASLVAPAVKPDQLSPPFQAAVQRGESIQRYVMNSLATVPLTELCTSPSALGSEIPAAGGVSNGRGLARMYAPLALNGEFNGTSLVDHAQIAEMAAVESAALRECVLLEPMRHSCGFQKTAPGRAGADTRYLSLSETAFGHQGLVGGVGFADPAVGLALGYATNGNQYLDEPPSARAQSLINAVYGALGHCDVNGRWVQAR